MARRRVEDERFAYFAEASIVFLDLPDAVFRGYEGDEQLLGKPRADDAAPYEILRREIARLEPQKVYLPLGIGGHVDHQLCRDVGVGLLNEAKRWVMPGPEYAGTVVFYEDFPYAYWNESGLDQLGADSLVGLPEGVSIFPTYADIEDQIERKITGITHLREPDRAAVRRRQGDGQGGPGVRADDGRARRGRRSGRALLGDQPRLSRRAPGWRRADRRSALVAVFAVGIVVRLVLLPTTGLRDDIDQFVGWVHHIATERPDDALRRHRRGTGHVRAGDGLHLGRRWPRSSRPSRPSPTPPIPGSGR